MKLEVGLEKEVDASEAFDGSVRTYVCARNYGQKKKRGKEEKMTAYNEGSF